MSNNIIVRNIPNTITCLNLASGCIAVVLAFAGMYQWASAAICAAAVFDFLDGAMARLLGAYSPLGRELDSLSDLISFGLAPAAMVYTFLPAPLSYFAIAIPICAGLRLARFNVDDTQTDSFRGLPVPANALFWIGTVSFWQSGHLVLGWSWALVILLAALSMVAPVRLPSLKFHDFKPGGENTLRYLLILLTGGCILWLGVPGLAVAIMAYFTLGAVMTLAGANR